MKWSLIYEFDVEIYRRAPTVRIYLQDILINEFTLDRKKTEVIEFEYSAQSQNNLVIEFHNNDNNYSNGFMTKYTAIIPIYFYIVPYAFAEHYKNIFTRHENNFSKKNYFIYRRTGIQAKEKGVKYGYEKIKHYYKRRAVYPQNLFNISEWPGNVIHTPLVTKVKYGSTEKFTYNLEKKYGLLLYAHNHKGFMQLDYPSKVLFDYIEENKNKYL